jgi:hypothetical protein
MLTKEIAQVLVTKTTKQISDKRRGLGLFSQEPTEAPEAVEEGGTGGGVIEHDYIVCEGELYRTIIYYRHLGEKLLERWGILYRKSRPSE